MNDPIHFLNVEYWFRLLYELFTGHHDISPSAYAALLAEWWRLLTVLAYLVAIGFIGALVYFTIRLYQIRKEEHHKFGTIHADAPDPHTGNIRWQHVQSLMAGSDESSWRQAIIEADVMLEDVLKTRGFQGDTLADRLQKVDPKVMPSIEDVWDAHKVRNRIAHDGSAFVLDQRLASRTIAEFENGFRDLGVI